MQDSQTAFFDIHKHFLGPDHVARKATDAKWNLQNFIYDCEKKAWDWDKYAILYKEQHAIIEILTE